MRIADMNWMQVRDHVANKASKMPGIGTKLRESCFEHLIELSLNTVHFD